MKTARHDHEPSLQPDLELAGACLACGGALSIRLRPGTSRSICRGCGWWSRPHLVQEEDGLHIRHRTAAVA